MKLYGLFLVALAVVAAELVGMWRWRTGARDVA